MIKKFKNKDQKTIQTDLCMLNNETNPNLSIFNSVKKYINIKFNNIYSKDNTVIILGYNLGDTIFQCKNKYPNKKIIVYQLEQLFNYHSKWFNPKSELPIVRQRTNHIKDWLDNADEIWDYDLDNISFLNSLGYKNIKYVPLEPIPELNYNFKINKEFDLVFFGSLNDRRYNILKELDKKYKLLVITHPSELENRKFKHYTNSSIGPELFSQILKAKMAINIHYYDSGIQEQVRIFELLSNNMTVISEKSRRNYLKVPEFNTLDEAYKLIDEHLLNYNKTYFEEIKNNEKIKIGVAYNTFYGLKQLINSIKSIRHIADYIVVIHQKIGCSGDKEPEYNKSILKQLLDNKLIDEVVYYNTNLQINPEDNILNKRNIGLKKCKENKCNYIIPMDADEEYDQYKLLKEIERMHRFGIETLYCPILTYYYNRNYYFLDTYYVPTVYRINDRLFGRYKTNVLCDPVRKMEERKYLISEVYMHHYSYMLEHYDEKINNNVMSVLDKSTCLKRETIFNYLKEFDGIHGYVQKNNLKGEIYFANVVLKRINETEDVNFEFNDNSIREVTPKEIVKKNENKKIFRNQTPEKLKEIEKLIKWKTFKK
jgi:hypothetical protein